MSAAGPISETDIKDILYFWLVNCGISTSKAQTTAVVQYGRAGTLAKIDHAYDGRGGWELWAQVEIAALIAENYAKTHIVTREERIYKDSDEATDLVIRDLNNKILQIIELKCERSTTGVVGQVKTDVVKLKKDLKDAYQGASCFAVGISCTDKGLAKIQNCGTFVHYQKCGKTPKGRPVTVFWIDLKEVTNLEVKEIMEMKEETDMEI